MKKRRSNPRADALSAARREAEQAALDLERAKLLGDADEIEKRTKRLAREMAVKLRLERKFRH